MAIPSIGQVPTRRKTTTPFAQASAFGQPNLALGQPLPPLPALGSSEPTSPFPGGGAGGLLAGIQAGRFAKASHGKTAAQTQEMYRGAGQPIPEQSMLRTGTPLGGGAGGGFAGLPGATGDLTQFGSLDQIEQAMRNDPRALAGLDPYFAVGLQQRSEEKALAEQQARAEQAIGVVAPSESTAAAAEAPDIAGTLGTPGLPESYWRSAKTARSGEVRQRFATAKAQIQEMQRRGASRGWAERKVGELADQEAREIIKESAAIDRERAELQEASKYKHAQTMLGLYGTAGGLEQRGNLAQAGIMRDFPTAGTNYTGGYDYLKGHARDDQAAMLGMAARAGGGGGGGIPNVGPDPNDFNWGGGVVGVPNPNFVPAQGRGGGVAPNPVRRADPGGPPTAVGGVPAEWQEGWRLFQNA